MPMVCMEKQYKGLYLKADEKKRYIHIYHSISKDADEREHFENALRERTALLMSHQNETVEFGSAYEKYFYLHYDKDGVFLYPEEKTTVTEREICIMRILCYYYIRKADLQRKHASL